MDDLEIAVAECPKIIPKWVPITPQEYIDRHAVIAFPPPDLGLIDEPALERGILDSTEIVYGSDRFVAILYESDVLYS